MAGHLVTQRPRATGAPLLPVDSEHSAIWQCLQRRGAVRRARRAADPDRLRRRLPRPCRCRASATVTPAEALRHPTWTMGPKITVDSATLMNKGLEVIEAHWLFDVPFDAIDVVIHRAEHRSTRWSSSSTARSRRSSACPTCACRSSTR